MNCSETSKTREVGDSDDCARLDSSAVPNTWTLNISSCGRVSCLDTRLTIMEFFFTIQSSNFCPQTHAGNSHHSALSTHCSRGCRATLEICWQPRLRQTCQRSLEDLIAYLRDHGYREEDRDICASGLFSDLCGILWTASSIPVCTSPLTIRWHAQVQQ